MAFVQKKQDKLATDARTARQNGEAIFTAGLGTDSKKWAQMVQSIEAEGWRLDHWAVGPIGTIAAVEAYPLFRAG